MDKFNLDKEVLFMFTDKGCDSNNKFLPVQISLTCLFILNVDLVIALKVTSTTK